MLMVLPMVSQSILKGESKTYINNNGDTLTVMHYEDARLLLADLMDYKIVDSLLTEYMYKDSINSNIIILSNSAITELKSKCDNKDGQIAILNHIILNKGGEVSMLNATIKQQKKEIRKQKIQKVIAIIGAIALPITTVVLMSQ